MSDDVKHDWDASPPVTKIDIDLKSVGGFGAALHDEVERNLRPNAARIAEQCDDEAVNFGVRTTTPAVYDMRLRYQESLGQTLTNMRAYVDASQLLVAAVQKIISEYGSADGISGEAANRILTDAVAAVSNRPNYLNAEAAQQYVSDVPDAFTPWDTGT
jgi:hypothetical protein